MSWAAAMAEGAAQELAHWGREVEIVLAGEATGYDPSDLEPIEDEESPEQSITIRATLATDEGVRVPVVGGGELSLIDAVWSTTAAQLTAASAGRNPREGDQVVQYNGSVESARWQIARVDRQADGIWLRFHCQRVQ